MQELRELIWRIAVIVQQLFLLLQGEELVAVEELGEGEEEEEDSGYES